LTIYISGQKEAAGPPFGHPAANSPHLAIMVRYSSRIPILLKFTAKSEYDELGKEMFSTLSKSRNQNPTGD
jgi:hypothetical protein